MESNNCYYSYSYSYFFNFHAELSTLENLEMLDLGSNGLNFSHKMQGKERERERERERFLTFSHYLSNFLWTMLIEGKFLSYSNTRIIMEMMSSDQDWWGLALLRSFVHKNEIIQKNIMQLYATQIGYFLRTNYPILTPFSFDISSIYLQLLSLSLSL